MIAELLLALTLTAVIGLTIAIVMGAAFQASAGQSELRSATLSQEGAADRLSATVRTANMVLACGSDYLVLWIVDKNTSEAPSLRQLSRIERDASTGQVWAYRAPPHPDPADDTLYSLSTTDFNAATNSVKGTSKFPGELWATDINAWSISLDNADPRLARLVGYRLTTSASGRTRTTAGATALRCP